MGYSGILGSGALHSLSFAEQTNNTFVFVFLRGGADSLQMAAPISDPNYISARPPELRILSSGSSPGVKLPTPFAPDQDCRLHPAAAPLLDLFQSGHAQLLHACGLSNATRSHFVAQEILEANLAGTQSRVLASTPGWFEPLLKQQNNGARRKEPRIEFVGTNTAQIRSLQGLTSGLNVSGELRNSLSLPGDAIGKSVLEVLYKTERQPNDALRRVAQETLQQIALLESKMPRTEGRLNAYQPPNKVTYNSENYEWVHALQTVAQLIRMDVGLRVACVDFGGWDTHEYQSGKINNLIRQWSTNLRALFDDLQAAGKNMTLVTVSEFGRRLRANASNGTDHGHAGAMWVLDTKGRHLLPNTQWPGLATHQLDQGLDLQHTHDIKKVLQQVAQKALTA